MRVEKDIAIRYCDGPPSYRNTALLRVNLGVDFGPCLANVAGVRLICIELTELFQALLFCSTDLCTPHGVLYNMVFPTNPRLIKSGEELDSKTYVFP